jgi:hypothetical protein
MGSRYIFIHSFSSIYISSSTNLTLCSLSLSQLCLVQILTGQGYLLCQCQQAWTWSPLATDNWTRSLFTLSSWFRSWGTFVYSLSLFFKHFYLLFLQLVMLFLQDESSWKSYSIGKGSMMDANYSLPDNVAIITLQVHNLFISDPICHIKYHRISHWRKMA